MILQFVIWAQRYPDIFLDCHMNNDIKIEQKIFHIYQCY